MEIVQPGEFVSDGPWVDFVRSLIGGNNSPAFIEAMVALMAGRPTVNLILYGPAVLVAGSEGNLDLLRGVLAHCSGLDPGPLDSDAPFKVHRYLHRDDMPALLARAEREINTTFFITSDCGVASTRWISAELAPTSGLAGSAFAFMRWLADDWRTANLEPRLALLRRWAQSPGERKPTLQVVT
ncbi:hypothetical protein SAMN02990966_07823 [Rhodospirillales bacterium URHD0017]|nr:hypothetical protein SAMN02990966_07823 [Rhodospirillales bacterium URHD0017]